jgi:hypothetical protein
MSDHQTALFQELVRARELARDIEQAHAKYFPDAPYVDARSSLHLFVRRASQATKAAAHFFHCPECGQGSDPCAKGLEYARALGLIEGESG